MTVEVFILGNIVCIISVRFDDCFSLGFVLLVLESGFPDFLCGSVSLTESILNPTVFCLISGVTICCYNVLIILSIKQELYFTIP